MMNCRFWSNGMGTFAHASASAISAFTARFVECHRTFLHLYMTCDVFRPGHKLESC